MRTLGALARQIRSKNAGPFWVTIDVFLESDEDYRVVAAPGFLNPELIAGLYRVPATEVQIFRMPQLRVLKISFPRRVPQGSTHDSDMHAAQQYVPLLSLPLPIAAPAS